MNDAEALVELINRRRRQILVHSVLYYRHDESLVADHVFDGWSRELVALQRAFPAVARGCVFADEFADFDGSTGYHLAGVPWAVEKAGRLLAAPRAAEARPGLDAALGAD